MAFIEYLSEHNSRILMNETNPGPAALVSLVVPTITRPGVPFEMHISVWDGNGQPVVLPEVSVLVEGEFARPAELEVRFQPDLPAIARIRELVITSAGMYRFSATHKGKRYFSNPTVCRERESFGIYWGDPHIHTVLSRCHTDRCRSLNFCYTAARHVSGLDWASAADHVSNGRCDEAKWKEQAIVRELYNQPGSFVTLPAYEESLKGGAGGDNNVYLDRNISGYIDHYEEGDVGTLCDALSERAEAESFRFFVAPHHTTRPGKHGEIPERIYPGSDLMPVVEIHSKAGTSEYPGNPDPLHSVHDGPSTVTDFLNQGYRLGFIGGTDTHCTLTWGRGTGFEADQIDRLPGITAVRVDELTREAIFTGIAERHCYAASGERIYLDVRVNGSDMGEVTTAGDGSIDISVEAAAASTIVEIEIVRNGEVIARESVGDWKYEWRYTDACDRPVIESAELGRCTYYYVRLRCDSGARAWSSPVWIVAETEQEG